jgi:hypothetical protein
MSERKEIPVGDKFLRAESRFKRKYADNPILLGEVNKLLNALQVWDLTVALHIISNSHGRARRPR